MGRLLDEQERERIERIERAANRGGAERKSAKSAPPESAAARERRRAKIRREMLAEALAEAGWTGRVTMALFGGVGLFGPVLGCVAIFGDSLGPAFGAAAVALLGGYAMYSLHHRMFAAIRRRRVVAFGYGFDVDAYFDALSEKRTCAIVVVRVTFTAAVPAQRAETLAAEVHDWLPAVTAAWQGKAGKRAKPGAVLEVRSDSISGTDSYDGDTTFTNARFHGCVLRIVDRVVPQLAAVAPIGKLAVVLEGAVAPFDAKA
jgi:hypothetical protein